jgi:hypothetical protein
MAARHRFGLGEQALPFESPSEPLKFLLNLWALKNHRD